MSYKCAFGHVSTQFKILMNNAAFKLSQSI